MFVNHRPAILNLASSFIRTRAREVEGHLAQCVFQGWCAISERALRTIPRLFANKKSNLELLSSATDVTTIRNAGFSHNGQDTS